MVLPARVKGVTALAQIFTQTPLGSPVFHLSAAELWSTHTLMLCLPVCELYSEFGLLTVHVQVSQDFCGGPAAT